MEREYSIDGVVFKANAAQSGLHVVATPIGNLSDISLRALKTLAGVDLIACEDTRNTGKLLKYFGIKASMIAYHEHNESKAGVKLIAALDAEKSIALVSDAGTPLISDPGYKLVTKARETGHDIIPIPGASAPLTALVASGLETESFLFAGFLPSKKNARVNKLNDLRDVNSTLIFFESPRRLKSSLRDMRECFGQQRKAAICRELTKLHEEISTGPLEMLEKLYAGRIVRGEIVIILGAPNSNEVVDIDHLLRELLETMSVSRAAGEASKLTRKNKRELYQRALRLVKKLDD